MKKLSFATFDPLIRDTPAAISAIPDLPSSATSFVPRTSMASAEISMASAVSLVVHGY